MSRDIFASLSGASAAWTQIELLAHNIANADTTGFKASRMSLSLSGERYHPLGESYAASEGETVDSSDGALVSDGVPTHLALQGEGFFVLQDGDETLYTRDGRFSIDTGGTLVDAGGLPVLGESGPITLEEGETFTIEPDGRIFGSKSGELDKIRIETADVVRPIGGNRAAPEGPRREGTARVTQGALERSNVDAMHAMVDLIAASRMFEAYQKAMEASDDLDARLYRMGG